MFTLAVREDTSSGRNENNCSTSRNVIDQNIGSHFITIFSAAKFKMADKREESTFEFFFNFVPQSFFCRVCSYEVVNELIDNIKMVGVRFLFS